MHFGIGRRSTLTGRSHSMWRRALFRQGHTVLGSFSSGPSQAHRVPERCSLQPSSSDIDPGYLKPTRLVFRARRSFSDTEPDSSSCRMGPDCSQVTDSFGPFFEEVACRPASAFSSNRFGLRPGVKCR